MSIFLSVVILTVFGVLATIAVANWQKGNLWDAMWWGIAAYVLLGAGAIFTYYYSVIQPAENAATTAIDRPELVFDATIDPLVAGKPVVITSLITNIGKATAYHVNVCTDFHVLPKSFKGPLEYSEDGAEEHQMPVVMPPSAPFASKMISTSEGPITEKQVAAIADGTYVLFWSVRGHYEDANGRKYPVSFCFMY